MDGAKDSVVRSGWPVRFNVAGRVCLVLGYPPSGKKRRGNVILGRRGNRAKCDFDRLFCGQEISSACGGAWGGFSVNIRGRFYLTPLRTSLFLPCLAGGQGNAQGKVKAERLCESSTIRLCNADIIRVRIRQHTPSWGRRHHGKLERDLQGRGLSTRSMFAMNDCPGIVALDPDVLKSGIASTWETSLRGICDPA